MPAQSPESTVMMLGLSATSNHLQPQPEHLHGCSAKRQGFSCGSPVRLFFQKKKRHKDNKSSGRISSHAFNCTGQGDELIVTQIHV